MGTLGLFNVDSKVFSTLTHVLTSAGLVLPLFLTFIHYKRDNYQDQHSLLRLSQKCNVGHCKLPMFLIVNFKKSLHLCKCNVITMCLCMRERESHMLIYF